MKLTKMLAGAAALVVSVGLAGVASATVLTGAMTADNAFYAWLGTSPNALGTLVASGNSWPTAFPVGPATLASGVTNYLNIEAINYGGPGGLSFVLNLNDTAFQFANGSQTLTSADLPFFTASYNNGSGAVTPQPWVPATGPAIPASYPWGNVVGTSSWADAVGGLNSCGYCTVDFTVAISAVGGVPEPSSWAMMLVGFGGLGAVLRSRRKLLGAFAV